MGLTLAPIIAGALQDHDGWRFTTDVLAMCAFGLAAVYGLLILIGCLSVNDYWKSKVKESVSVEMAQELKALD